MTHADLLSKEARLIARKIRLQREHKSTEAVQREHERLKMKILRKELREERKVACLSG